LVCNEPIANEINNPSVSAGAEPPTMPSDPNPPAPKAADMQ
jgi:hypothetical protein